MRTQSALILNDKQLTTDIEIGMKNLFIACSVILFILLIEITDFAGREFKYTVNFVGFEINGEYVLLVYVVVQLTKVNTPTHWTTTNTIDSGSCSHSH
jgi:hypothetical protein